MSYFGGSTDRNVIIYNIILGAGSYLYLPTLLF